MCCTTTPWTAFVWSKLQLLHPLAPRIREEGTLVYGFGQRKTLESFVAACDEFIYTETLIPEVVIAKPNKAEEAIPALPDLQPYGSTLSEWVSDCGLTLVRRLSEMLGRNFVFDIFPSVVYLHPTMISYRLPS